MSKLIDILDKAKDLIYPNDFECVICGFELVSEFNFGLCANCIDQISVIDKDDNICEKCGKKLPYDSDFCEMCEDYPRAFEENRSVFEYDGLGSLLLFRFKEKNRKYLAVHFAKMLARKYRESEFDCDLIIPVPLSKEKQKERGYNQSALIAHELSKLLDIEAVEDVLIKTRDTLSQTALSWAERQTNLKNAYEITDKRKIFNKNILLIDDIYTTGATLHECASTFLQSTAASVRSLTIATTMIKKKIIKN
jgi:ComF family protein